MMPQRSLETWTYWMPATGSILQFWTSKTTRSIFFQRVVFERRTIFFPWMTTMMTLFWHSSSSDGHATILRNSAPSRIISRTMPTSPPQTVTQIYLLLNTIVWTLSRSPNHTHVGSIAHMHMYLQAVIDVNVQCTCICLYTRSVYNWDLWMNKFYVYQLHYPCETIADVISVIKFLHIKISSLLDQFLW